METVNKKVEITIKRKFDTGFNDKNYIITRVRFFQYLNKSSNTIFTELRY